MSEIKSLNGFALKDEKARHDISELNAYVKTNHNLVVNTLLGCKEREPDTSLYRLIEKLHLKDASVRFADWQNAYIGCETHYYSDIMTAIQDYNASANNHDCAFADASIAVYSYGENTDVKIIKLLKNTAMTNTADVDVNFPFVLDLANYELMASEFGKPIHAKKDACIYSSTKSGVVNYPLVNYGKGAVVFYSSAYIIGVKFNAVGSVSKTILAFMLTTGPALRFMCVVNTEICIDVTSSSPAYGVSFIGLNYNVNIDNKYDYDADFVFDGLLMYYHTSVPNTRFKNSLMAAISVMSKLDLKNANLFMRNCDISVYCDGMTSEDDGDTIVNFDHGNIAMIDNCHIRTTRELSLGASTVIINNSDLGGESHGGYYAVYYALTDNDRVGTTVCIMDTTLRKVRPTTLGFSGNDYCAYFGYGSNVYCDNVNFVNDVGDNRYPRITSHTVDGLKSNYTSLYLSNCSMNGMSSDANGTIYYGRGIPDIVREAPINGTKVNTNDIYRYGNASVLQFHVTPDGTVHAGNALEIGETMITEAQLQALLALLS